MFILLNLWRISQTDDVLIFFCHIQRPPQTTLHLRKSNYHQRRQMMVMMVYSHLYSRALINTKHIVIYYTRTLYSNRHLSLDRHEPTWALIHKNHKQNKVKDTRSESDWRHTGYEVNKRICQNKHFCQSHVLEAAHLPNPYPPLSVLTKLHFWVMFSSCFKLKQPHFKCIGIK